MVDYFTPSDAIEGIATMENEGETQEQIILTIALNLENQAKQVLIENGYEPKDFKLSGNCYVAPKGLTEREIIEDKRQWKYYKWVNEATQIIGHDDFIINQAANTIIEAGQLRHFVELGETSKVGVSMAILLSCGFLNSDQDKDVAIAASSKRNEKLDLSKNGTKGGISAPSSLYITLGHPCPKIHSARAT